MLQAEVTAKDSRVTAVLQHPGANIKGKGANLHGGAFPTVWAPFHSGWVFRTADSAAPPGTVLHFSNVTLVLSEATYTGTHGSGFMDFLDLGKNGHVCFTNRCASMCLGEVCSTMKSTSWLGIGHSHMMSNYSVYTSH